MKSCFHLSYKVTLSEKQFYIRPSFQCCIDFIIRIEIFDIIAQENTKVNKKMKKIESSKHEVSDFDNRVEIEIDNLEETLCRKYYQVIRFYGNCLSKD